MTTESSVRPRWAAARAVAWAALAAATALLLVGLSYLHPVLPIVAVAAGAMLLVAAFRPKAFALITALVIVTSTLLEAFLGTLGGYADEGMIALAVTALLSRRLITEGRIVWLPGLGWFVGFVAIGLLSTVSADGPFSIAVPAAFIAVKGVLFALALAQLRWTRDDLVVLIRVGLATIAVVALTGLLNLVAPATWANLLTGNPPMNGVGPLPALSGLFQHPAAFSRFCGALAVACLTYGLVVRRSLANTLLTAVTTGLAFLTFQVKSIVGLLATMSAIGARFLRPAGAMALLCAAPVLALVAAPPLLELVGADFALYVLQDSARSELTYGGFLVAAQYFPLGAGFGMYGSSTAAAIYSPIYYELGFPGRYGLSPGTGQYLNDNQWPAILGETGWLGAACFAAGVLAMLVSLMRRTSPAEDRLVRWIRLTGIGWMVLLLVESLASPVFVSPPSYPFMFAVAGIAASFRSGSRAREAGGDRPQAGSPAYDGPRAGAVHS
ncbi:hypothetical protein [Blastococcus sp. KM273129]|uniref:hypothetical protein n=1 Tax=Blastococcus sp. KM273129 TaxID=2570315 RepID=UPI001F3F02FC|nr:hypothetical protein [Blastococcus sp. KM273129]MCF6736930.1 hypothetical protein [Blastococcus sp. KM273129]